MQNNADGCFPFYAHECTVVIYTIIIARATINISPVTIVLAKRQSSGNIPQLAFSAYSRNSRGLSDNCAQTFRVIAYAISRNTWSAITYHRPVCFLVSRIAPEIQSHTGQRYKVFSPRVFRDVLIFNLEREKRARAPIFLKAFLKERSWSFFRAVRCIGDDTLRDSVKIRSPQTKNDENPNSPSALQIVSVATVEYSATPEANLNNTYANIPFRFFFVRKLLAPFASLVTVAPGTTIRRSSI